MSLPGIGGLQGGVADPYKQTKAPKAKSKALIDQEITKKGEEKENIALVFKEDHYSKTNDERELKINAEDRLYRLKREPLFVSRGVDRQTEIINKLVLQDDRDRLRNDRNQILTNAIQRSIEQGTTLQPPPILKQEDEALLQFNKTISDPEDADLIIRNPDDINKYSVDNLVEVQTLINRTLAQKKNLEVDLDKAYVSLKSIKDAVNKGDMDANEILLQIRRIAEIIKLNKQNDYDIKRLKDIQLNQSHFLADERGHRLATGTENERKIEELKREISARNRNIYVNTDKQIDETEETYIHRLKMLATAATEEQVGTNDTEMRREAFRKFVEIIPDDAIRTYAIKQLHNEDIQEALEHWGQYKRKFNTYLHDNNLNTHSLKNSDIDEIFKNVPSNDWVFNTYLHDNNLNAHSLKNSDIDEIFKNVPSNDWVEEGSGLKNPKSKSAIKEKSLGVSNIKFPNYVEFGKYLVNPNKLFYDNILSIRDHNHYTIGEFPSIKISGNFVDALLDVLKGNPEDKHVVAKLSSTEQALYHRLLVKSGLIKHENYAVKDSKSSTIEHIKNRLAIISGEINAGNNNKDLIEEERQLVMTLRAYKAITQKEANRYLSGN